jgi:hypothetical protein
MGGARVRVVCRHREKLSRALTTPNRDGNHREPRSTAFADYATAPARKAQRVGGLWRRRFQI